MKPIPTVLAAPWAIEAQWLRVVFAVWSRGQLDAEALGRARADWDARRAAGPQAEEPGAAVEGTGGTLRIVGDVGVITIAGPLFRHANLMSDFSGGTTYDAVWRGLEAALASSAVRSILLRLSTPGGEADGVNELGKYIAAAGERKPVWAYADGMCASAGYWLASQCSHIVAEETAELGSIGVRCGLVDDSAADQMAGVREIEIVSSVSPGKRSTPVDDEVIGRMQTRIDDLAAIFIDAVAAGRGVSADEVLESFGRGDVMIASKALAAGMVDEIGDFNGTLAALSASARAPQTTSAARAARATRTSMKNTIKAKAEDGGEQKHEPVPMRCSECSGDMTGKAAYCATCYDGDHAEPDGDEGDDEMKALAAAGLLGKTKAATRAALVGFALAVLEATGAKSAAAALARSTANTAAASELEALKARVETDAATARQAGVAAKLTAAIKAGRVTLSMATKELPILLGASKAAARAELEKLVTVDMRSVVAALTSVPISTEAAESIDEWLAAKQGSALPGAVAEPLATGSHLSVVRDAGAKASEGVEVDEQGNPNPSTSGTSPRVFSIAALTAASKKE